jgi:hypothetical protein
VRGEAILLFASWPLGAILSDSARLKLSEIPSQTRSVSAFLSGRVSVGPRSFGQFRSRQHGSLIVRLHR